MKNAFLLLRADANSEIGFGHLIRMMTIHKTCQKLEIASAIITDKLDNEAKKWLDHHRVEHFPVEKLNEYTDNILRIILLFDIDHPLSTQKDYEILNESATKDKSVTKLAFADLSKKWKITGIDQLIYPYVGYKKDLHPDDQRQIHGPEYFILREEIQLRSQKKTINSLVRTILITMGGSNPGQSIEKALEICLNLTLNNPVRIIVLVGPSAKLDLSEIEKKIKESRHEVVIHWNNSEFEQSLSEADLIITNDGLTKYETLFLGIPTATLVSQKRNESLMNDFARETGILNLGYCISSNLDQMTHSLEELVISKEKRRKMSEKGKAVIDGKGAERLLKIIL